MRAAAQALSSESSPAALRVALRRVAIALAATALLLSTWRPVVVHAQSAPPAKADARHPTVAPKPDAQLDSARRLHIVKGGETLWMLAEQYYGDGHQWTELARDNALQLKSGKPLLVGMKLRVPAPMNPSAKHVSSAPAADIPEIAKIPAKAPSSGTPAPAVASTSLADQTTDKSDSPPPARRESAEPASRRVAVRPRVSSTITSSSPNASAGRDASTDGSPTAFAEPRGRQRELVAPEHAFRIGLVDVEDLRAARSSAETTTVFLRRVPEAIEVDAQAKAIALSDAPAPRRGEYEAAPFSVDPSTVRSAGKILRRVGAPADIEGNEVQRLILADDVEITAPSGAPLAVGDRLMILRLTPAEIVKGRRGAKAIPVARIAIPTGILRVQRLDAGKPILASVQRQSSSIEQGQILVRIEGSAAALDVHAVSSRGSDIETTVRWVDDTESLPTMQSFLLLAAGSEQGVHAGDEFELQSPRVLKSGAGGESIARVRVVRVGAKESAAIIVHQMRTDIAVGVAARRIARVP